MSDELILETLVGKKITFLGCRKPKRKTDLMKIEYIFFDDGETFISLEDQDYYSYHDCDESAKVILLQKNKDLYNNYMIGLVPYRVPESYKKHLATIQKLFEKSVQKYEKEKEKNKYNGTSCLY